MAMEEYSFGLRACKIAPWTAAATWGTAIAVDSARVLGIGLDMVNGRLEGDDRRTSLFSIPVGGTVRLEFGFKSLDLLASLTSNTASDTGTTKTTLIFDWTPNPYWGVIGQIYHETVTGAYEFFLPKCKIMGSIPFNLQYGQYLAQNIEAEFIYDDATWGFGTIIGRATAVTPTIPPTA